MNVTPLREACGGVKLRRCYIESPGMSVLFWNPQAGRAFLAASLFFAAEARGADEPATPGSVALLVLEAPAAAADRLAAALKSEDAAVRATAARVGAVTSAPCGCDALQAALASEKDLEASREEIRGVALLCPDSASILVGRLDVIPEALHAEVAFALARRLGPEAGALGLGVLRPALARPPDAERFFRIAARGRPETATDWLSTSANAGDAGAFRAIARNALRDGAAPPAATLRAGLASPNDEIASAAAWLAALSFAGRPLVERSAWTSSPERAATEDPDTLFGFDVLRRVAGGGPPPAAPWLPALRAGASTGLDDVPPAHAVFGFLTAAEKAALATRRVSPIGARALGRVRWVMRTGRGQDARPVVERLPLLRTVTDLPRGAATGVAKITRCSLARASFALADVTFRPIGTPEGVKLRFLTGDSACRRTALALFALSIPPGDYLPPAGSAETLAVVFDADALAATDEEPVGTPDARAVGPGTGVKEPKETRRLKPEYPEALRRLHMGGAALLTARIDREGRVKDVRVVEPAGTLATVARDGTSLDVEAVRSLVQWRYEPARVDGVAVPVLLSVTVSWSTR